MRVFLLLIVFIFFSGCGASLRTLMQLDKEQKEQQQYLASQNKRFKLLLKRIKENKLKVGEVSKVDIIRLYGEPIMEKSINGKERLLYRNPRDFFPSQKVYLFFDEDGILRDFEVKSDDSGKNS